MNDPGFIQALDVMANAVFYMSLAGLPLIEIEKIGDSDPIAFAAHPSAPLDGVRVLGLARVIAGAAIGRAMAHHGADVEHLAAERF